MIFHNNINNGLGAPGVQDEWTGEQRLQYNDVSDDIEPVAIRTVGNYAVAISWPDGFEQVSLRGTSEVEFHGFL